MLYYYYCNMCAVNFSPTQLFNARRLPCCSQDVRAPNCLARYLNCSAWFSETQTNVASVDQRCSILDQNPTRFCRMAFTYDVFVGHMSEVLSRGVELHITPTKKKWHTPLCSKVVVVS